MYDVYVLDYIACSTSMAAMPRNSVWVAKPTQNQIQKSDFLYAAGICVCAYSNIHTYIQ